MTAHDAHAASAVPWPWLAVAVLVGVLVGGYLLAVARRRQRTSRQWPVWRTASWATGAVLLGAALSPPVVDLAHADARGHMAQHLLLGMYAPLALVMAAPVTLLLGAVPPPLRRTVGAVLGSRVVHVLAHPAVAGVLNVGGLYVLYLTDLYAASTREPLLHALVNLHFVLAGCLFTWAVAGPDPAPRRPGTTTRVVALVLAAAAHAFLAKLLYARAPELPPGAGHPTAEVEAAAQWMYYGGDGAEVLLAVTLFAGWYRTRQPFRARGTARASRGAAAQPGDHSSSRTA